MNKVVFTDTIGVDEQYAPVPATKVLPDWYKNTPDYVDGERLIKDGQTPHTIKKCIPVFDAMTAGYILKTYVDVQVTQRDGLPYYEWPNHGAITFHPVRQAPEHPSRNDAPYPKWSNPWSISTPRGWSSLILPPMHNPNGVFSILPGLVDTDTYTAPINFPFTLDDVSWEGLIPAGTPMAQIVPINRKSWRMSIGGDSERVSQARVTNKLASLWFHSYKRQFWSRKEYR